MELMWWWLLPVWVAVFLVLFFILRHHYKKRAAKLTKEVPLAHTEILKQLPSFDSVRAKYRLWRIALFTMATLTIVSLMLVSLRPMDTSIVEPQQKNRDIMLCLDVSGSMWGVDYDIFTKFIDLVDNFDGQRIGLIVFDSSAAVVFPLTDDYELVKEYLTVGQAGFSDESANFDSDAFDAWIDISAGTFEGNDSSLSGEGLMSCVNHMDFGSRATERAQSIVLATDNVHGQQLMTVLQAASVAKERNIRVYSIDPNEFSFGDFVSEESKELQDASELTEGKYYGLDDISVPAMIDDISRQEATFFAGTPTVAESDVPLVYMAIAGGTMALFVFAAWRLRI
jgi:hypothetical protein